MNSDVTQQSPSRLPMGPQSDPRLRGTGAIGSGMAASFREEKLALHQRPPIVDPQATGSDARKT